MENQSHSQKKSSEDKITERIKKKDNFITTIKDNLNYIYIVLMILANIIISLVTIEDGSIGVHYPSNALGWVLWVLAIIFQTIIGVLILNAFRRQGIKLGHTSIKEVYNEYIKEVQKNAQQKEPRSLKQYMGKEATKDSIIKAFFYIILSLFFGSVVLGTNLNTLLSLIANIIFAIGFGIKALIDAEEFVIKELVIWYKKQIANLKNKDKEKSDDRKRKRTMHGARYGEPSGVQQKEECSTGQPDCNNQSNY